MKAWGIGEKIWWVGAMDWDRKLFDSLIPLPDGTSYNSYFVQGERKSALIDAVDPQFTQTLCQRLQSLNIQSLDYVVANHIEQDHSGAIPDILALYPMAKAVTSEKGKGMMLDLLDIPEEKILVVQDGDIIDLGGKTLRFIYFPWVHWPETMLTWVDEDKTLFSCDLFGSHLATADLCLSDTRIVYPAAKRYFAEIMMPFQTVIQSNLWKVQNLEPKIIAPSHGPIHKQPLMIIDAYRDWVEPSPKNQVLVPFISMHDSTRIMVDYFIEACADRGIHAVKINLEDTDIGKFAMELVDASGIVFGSPMVLGGPHPKVAYAALLANALRPKIKFISVIGSFGWGGKLAETIKSLTSNLKAEMLPPVLVKGLPKKTDLEALDALAAAVPIVPKHPLPELKKSDSEEITYMCQVCHYVYDSEKGDPDGGIAPGTPFENIPDNWVCPLCHMPKRMFKTKS
jgi:flavorubredoxin/rubredoxin